MIAFDFAPSASRARLLNVRMHMELGQSLAYIVAETKDALNLDVQAIQPLLHNLANGENHKAVVFADYYDLVQAIEAEDYAGARALYQSLTGARPIAPDLQVATLGAPALGDHTTRFKRMMNSDPSVELGFVEPQPKIAAAFEERLGRGLGLLDAALPELAGEVRAIIREVVIAGSDPTKTYQFDGGSHFQLWGALFLNCQYHPDDIAVCEVLAHESAHSLLFGFCTDEGLVLNGEEELYASPLRVDRRPMDGIYHATFVSARMHWAMTQLARSSVLTAEQRGRAFAAAEADLVNFDAGYGVVAEHGILTTTGAGLMQGAYDYMQSVR